MPLPEPLSEAWGSQGHKNQTSLPGLQSPLQSTQSTRFLDLVLECHIPLPPVMVLLRWCRRVTLM